MCEKSSKKIIDLDKLAERVGESIPQEDYERFVKPYDSARVLADIRAESGKGN